MNRRWAVWIAGLIPVLAILYLLFATALGFVSVNRDFRSTPVAAGGIAIYLRTNRVHSDIVLPTRAGDHDWSAAFPPSQMRALWAPAPWIAFGWGDRAFMLETPTWRDIRLGTSLRAISGLGSLLRGIARSPGLPDRASGLAYRRSCSRASSPST